MKIIRADINDTVTFSKDELRFGGCCFSAEDKLCRYFFKIEGRDATLFSNSGKHIPEIINEFLFYSGFISTIRDDKGTVLLDRPPIETCLYEIDKLQPSQFYYKQNQVGKLQKMD